MFFTDDKNLRQYEFLMKGVPNFKPRGHGMLVVCGIDYMPMHETKKQLILWATQNIRHHGFRMRLNNYLSERGEYIMNFISKSHRVAFEDTVKRVNGNDKKLLAAIYLLTADFKLCRSSGIHIREDDIIFKNISTKHITDSGYTLLCAAKDLYLGTRYICISDMCDESVIPSEIFGLICNALAIKRFGLRTIKCEEMLI